MMFLYPVLLEQSGANDLQTLADRLVQKSICASLSKSFPKVTIIGEEELPAEAVEEDLIENGQSNLILQKSCPDQYASLKEEELVVWVDPLDGTKEYTEAARVLYSPVYIQKPEQPYRSPNRTVI
uniref:Bisphosphate nucleotidase 1 n=1 Tax=Cyprinus carpio TaxID=7962 RepID=A0A8C2HLX0_CYPCA